jgi:hypothetical protein
MSAVIFNTDRVPSCDDVVSALLSGHPLGQPVSTRSMLMGFRAAVPTSLETDDRIVESVVRIATGRTMAVVFDHRAAPEQPSISWRQTGAAI